MSCGCGNPRVTPPATHPTPGPGQVPTIAGKAFPNCKPCCDCEPDPCKPECEPPSHAIRCAQKVRITPTVLGTALPATACGCGGAAPNLATIEAWVRRRGQCAFLIKYPAWDVTDDGWIEFRWDDALYALPPGRYEAELRNSGFVCGYVELVIGPECAVSTRRHRPVADRTARYPTTKPAGANTVFDAIAGYNATFCAVLERGSTVLPLCGPDLAALCAASLCKPVQLVISDGVNSEIVTFAGCDGAAATVVRGNPQHKFPKGATVVFAWTPANVQGAMTPCP